MRFQSLGVGLLLGFMLTACSGNPLQSPTNAPAPTKTPAPTESLVEVTVTYLDADDDFESAFEFASAKEPAAKGEMLMMASMEISFSFEIVDFVRGEQALAMIATIDPTYTGPPAGYEVGLVRAVIGHGNVHDEPVVFDGSMVSLLVLSNGEYVAVKDMQDLPCCFEPRFDAPVAKDTQTEIYFPILVAVDDPNPLVVINRDNSDNADARHFALQ